MIRKLEIRWTAVINILKLTLLMNFVLITVGEQCGIAYQRQGFVIGGSEVNPIHSWPWTVSIRDQSHFGLKHFCGGVLISRQLVLTAAHCMYTVFGNKRRPRNLQDIYVAVGAHKLRELVQGERWIRVAKLHLHPRFDDSRVDAFHNDLALLQLRYSIPDNDRDIGRPVCLPEEQASPVTGQRCVVTGWGYDSDHRVADSMRQAVIPVISRNICRRKTHWSSLVSDSMLCAGLISRREGGAGTCEGDSGGPLLCSSDGHTWAVNGVVSWGPAICLSKPGVFADVATMRPWINSVARSNGLTLPHRLPSSNFQLSSAKTQDKDRRRVESNCGLGKNWELIRRLEVRGRPLRAGLRRNVSLEQCVLDCCSSRQPCVAIHYLASLRRCTLLAEGICSMPSERIIYPTARLTFYVGLKCHRLNSEF